MSGYDNIRELQPLKEYGGEKCEFPGFVFRGWLIDPTSGDKWHIEMCPWAPDYFRQLFSEYEWNRIMILYWECRQGKFLEV